jgi:hypothetical protein
MSLLIFIPGKFGPNLDHLSEVGLADLLRDGDRGPNASDLVHGGPGGAPGVLFSWDVAQYKPDAQTWQPCKPDPARGLAAGRFWFGSAKDSTPGPDDFLRDAPARLRGFPVELADGREWLVPNGMMLPCRFALDESGQPAKVPTRPVEKIHERTLWAFQAAASWIRGEAEIPWPEALDYAAFMLSLNYRVNLEICLTLELFDEKNLGLLLARSTDLDTLLAIQKKTAASTSAG